MRAWLAGTKLAPPSRREEAKERDNIRIYSARRVMGMTSERAVR